MHSVLVLYQWCTNPKRQVAMAIKVRTVAPNASGSRQWNFLHVTLLAPKILGWFTDRFLENLCTRCTNTQFRLLTY
jgi:hypothetical protein